MRKVFLVLSLSLLLLLVSLFPTSAFSQFYLNVSTVQVNSQTYMVYEFGPEFTLGPVLIGVTLTTYATDLTSGQFYFGTPGAGQPSTNIVDGLNIISLGLDLGTFWFRYGHMKPITYGMGFVFNGYKAPNSRTLDTGLRMGTSQVSVHIPYELRQLSTFSFQQSDSLYSANVNTKLLMFDLSIFGGFENDENLPLQYAAGASLTLPVLGFSVGIEGGALMWRDGKSGYGLFGGIFGDFGALQVVAGPYFSTEYFKPWLIGKSYYDFKSSLDPTDYEQQLGYVAKAAFSFENYAKILVELNGTFEGNVVLGGEGIVNVPAIAGTNGLVIYGYLYDNTPFKNGKMFDDDTIARLVIAYPAFQNFYAGIKYRWNGTDWIQEPFIGGRANF